MVGISLEKPDSFGSAEDRVDFVAKIMDEAVELPGGFKLGLDPVLSLIPVSGDIAGAVIGIYIILEAALSGVPKRVLVLMIAITVIDSASGTIPVAGPVIDAIWKANTWNVSLFKKYKPS